MHKSATKCNETIGKWCKNKHGASKIIDTLETYQCLASLSRFISRLGEKALPLYQLMKKSDTFVWTMQADAAFKELK
jgi:hypothetical protein